MLQRRISMIELGLIAATRGMLGVGIGLLISLRLKRRRRRVVGSALAAAGALSTIPLAFRVLRRPPLPPVVDEEKPWRPDDDPMRRENAATEAAILMAD